MGLRRSSQVENSQYATGPNHLNLLRGYTYAKPRGVGSIRVWGIGRGDELTIVVTLSER